MFRELVANEGTRMRDQGLHHCLLKRQGQIQIGPCLVLPFDVWHPEHKVVYILNVAVVFTTVTQAKYHGRHLDGRKCHEMAGTRHHLGEIV
jgi:hypothetical protein